MIVRAKHHLIRANRRPHRSGVTLLELLVVVLIIGILATIAVGVYTGQVTRAKVAATQDLVRQLELAITRYEVDTGTLPPSGTGDIPLIPISPGNSGTRTDGSGLLELALVHSLSGNSLQPASPLWKGPYISFQASQLLGERLSDGTRSTLPGHVNILDAFGSPIYYIQSVDYPVFGAGTFSGGTRIFTSVLPQGANPSLPAPNPYANFGETYYNPSTYEIYSFGPNATTLSAGGLAQFGYSYRGAESDDITNFSY